MKFFVVPIGDCGAAEEEVNAFLRGQRVLAVEYRWVDQGSASFWAVCVDYVDPAPGGQNAAARHGAARGKVDYKEVLSAEEFAVFARLRDLRKEIAQTEAIPVYTVLTNSQLAQIVQQRVKTATDLARIEGIGAARTEKYAARILPLLAQLPEPTDAADGKSV